MGSEKRRTSSPRARRFSYRMEFTFQDNPIITRGLRGLKPPGGMDFWILGQVDEKSLEKIKASEAIDGAGVNLRKKETSKQ